MSLRAKILLIALVLLVVAYISAISYTVMGSDFDKQVTGQTDFYDPVTLRTIEPVAENISDMPMKTLPPIRIPVRPTMRSPFRPLWASGQQIETRNQ